MHQGEINPSPENSAVKSNLGCACTTKGVCLPLRMSLETPGGAEGQTLSLSLQHKRLGAPGCSDGLCGDTDKPSSRAVPGQGQEQHGHSRNTHSTAKNSSAFNSGQYKEHLEESVFLEKFQQSAVEVTPPHGGFARVESLLHGEVTVLGHAWFPQRSLQENSCRKTVRESELSPRQWGWFGNGCDFYSPKFDRLPRFVLFVFLRETFYGTQKYFANENKKATYRRLCEPPHRQMLLNTVFNWD